DLRVGRAERVAAVDVPERLEQAARARDPVGARVMGAIGGTKQEHGAASRARESLLRAADLRVLAGGVQRGEQRVRVRVVADRAGALLEREQLGRERDV